MHLDDGVVEVDQDAAVDPVQHRSVGVQPLQQTRCHGVELADMTEGERPQERAQGRGRIRSGEHLAHRAVAQQRHVGDAVRAGHHAGDKGTHLPPGIGALVGRHAEVAISQAGQLTPAGQCGHRHQPGARHQIRVIKDRCSYRTAVR